MKPTKQYANIGIVDISECIGKPVAFKSPIHYFFGMLSKIDVKSIHPLYFHATLNGDVAGINESFEVRLLE